MKSKWGIIVLLFLFVSISLLGDVYVEMIDDQPRDLLTDIGLGIEYILNESMFPSYLLTLNGEYLKNHIFSVRLDISTLLMTINPNSMDSFEDTVSYFSGAVLSPDITWHLFDRSHQADSKVVVRSKLLGANLRLVEYIKIPLPRRNILGLRFRGRLRFQDPSLEFPLGSFLPGLGLSWTSFSNASLYVLMDDESAKRKVDYSRYLNLGVYLVLTGFDASRAFGEQTGLELDIQYGSGHLAYFAEALVYPLAPIVTMDLNDSFGIIAKLGISFRMSHKL